MGLLQIVKNAFKIPELRKKLLMTLLLILIFRVGCFIPVPGLNGTQIAGLAGDGLFEFMDILSGGAFENVSLFAMGISPYINASIIIQLLTVAIPALERLQKEGEEGRKIINRITRYVSVALAVFQAIMLYINMYKSKSSIGSELFTDAFGTGFWADALICVTMILSFTAGTAILVWLGEKITDVGIGNGISVLIFAGIVASAPEAIKQMCSILYHGTTDMNPYTEGGSYNIAKEPYIRIPFVIAVILAFLVVILAVVWMEGGERRIPVQYAKRVVGRKMLGGQSTHIPLKVNSSGVLPIIFAMSLLQFPITIASFVDNDGSSTVTKGLNDFVNTWWYLLVYAVLIVGFTFFYNIVYFDSKEIANNLKNNGGTIIGTSLRPGKPTADYIQGISTRITWFGAFFLAVLAIMPSMIQKLVALGKADLGNFNLWIGGTSVLILVGVALETMRQLEAQILMRHYKGGKGGFLG